MFPLPEPARMPVKVRKKWWIVACAMVVVAAVVVVISLRSKEPAYHGKTVSLWLKEITLDPPHSLDISAQRAFASMGLDAVPFIIADLRRYDSSRDRLYARLYPKLPSVLQRRLPSPFQPWLGFSEQLERGHSDALVAAIGSAVEGYLPSLLSDRNVHLRRAGALILSVFPSDERVAYRLMARAMSDDDPVVRVDAVSAVKRLKARGVPLLVRALEGDDSGGSTNQMVCVRAYAAIRLGELGQDARAAVPKLNQLLRASRARASKALGPVASGAALTWPQMIQRDNDVTEAEAAIALLKIGRNQEMVAMLADVMTNTADEYIMSRIVNALGQFGPGAKAATPMLIEIYRKHNAPSETHDQWGLREKVGGALKQIDPAAAAKAGAK